MDMDENKHCVETKYSCKYHYKDNRACGWQDNPDRVELKPIIGSYPTLDFEMPRQRFELDRVERLMSVAYDRGKFDQMRLIRSTLKEIIGI